MKKFVSRAAICLLAICIHCDTRAAELAAVVKNAPHPWLFMTTNDVARVRHIVATEPAFAVVAEALEERARSRGMADLPPLETNWWQEARKKTWKETYPEVNHHTGNVPIQWASLALDCARASLLDDSTHASAKAKEILLRLSNYTFEFEHFDVGMNYTEWGADVLQAYDILYERFGAGERARMDAFFARMLVAVQKNDAFWVEHEPGGSINNHYAWHKLCYVMLGAFYGKPELIEQAIHGPKGIEFMMQYGFRDDGLWVEGSIPYQLVATDPLLKAAELLENFAALTGATDAHVSTLYGFQTRDGRTLVQSYRALVPLLWPDRTLPAIGDAYAHRPNLSTHADFEILFRRFRDPTFGWLLTENRSPSVGSLFQAAVRPIEPVAAPAQKSKLWPESGYIALRSNEGTNYWTGQGWSVFATYANRPIHHHADKLSLALFSDGHLWLPDIEERSAAEHQFSSAVQTQLNRHTLCHNTIVIDGENQRFPAQPLDLSEFQALPEVKRATFGDLRGQLYPGVRQMRTVIVTTNYVLDFMQVQANAAHEVGWLTHVDGRSLGSSIKRFGNVKLPQGAAWSYLKNAQGGEAGKHYTERFSAGDAHKVFHLDLWSDKSFQLVTCGFPVAEGKEATIPMRMATSKTDNVWYLAVYRIGPASLPPLEATVEPGPLNSWKIFVADASRANEPKTAHIVRQLPRLP